MSKRTTTLIALAALTLAACGDDGGPSAASSADVETTATTTTASSTTPTTAASTTEPAVPDDVQDGYREAGQPPLTEKELETFTNMCDGLQQGEQEYLDAFDRRDDSDQAMILENIEPLCPDVAADMEGRTTPTTEPEPEGFSRDAVVAIERCVGALGSAPEVTAEHAMTATRDSARQKLDDWEELCEEAQLQADADAETLTAEAEVSLALHEIVMEVSFIGLPSAISPPDLSGVTQDEADEFAEKVHERIDIIRSHPDL